MNTPNNPTPTIVEALKTALEFYADPATYFGIAFIGDPPCGEFQDDFEEIETDWNPKDFKPGKRARAALLRAEGEQHLFRRDDEDAAAYSALVDDARKENDELIRAEGEGPIPMVLHCPACGLQHIDAPDLDDIHWIDGARSIPWTNPPHRSHLCQGCGHIWRPADVPTEGVAAVQTRGSADSPLAQSHPPTASVDLAVRLPPDLTSSRQALELLGATPGQFDMPLSGGEACWWRVREGDAKPNALIVYTKAGDECAAYPGDWVVRSGGYLDVIPAPAFHPAASVEAVARENAGFREVLTGIRQYANDTLSGRADGPDDRAWQREAVAELRDRAAAALTAQQHPGLGSGGPTEEPDGGRSGSSWSPPEGLEGALRVAVCNTLDDWRADDIADEDGVAMGLVDLLAGPKEKTVKEALDRRERLADLICGEITFVLRDAASSPSVATGGTGVVPATTPSAPIPTEDHEQGVRGSEERAGGEGE